MQQILDRTQESLAQAFASLARNARRQQHLYYATVGLLIVIIIVSGLLLAGLAAARHLDIRRSQVAQYVSTISLQLQSQASFLRRTALTINYYLAAASDTPPDPNLVAPIRQSGVARSRDGKFVLLVPEATRREWGDTLPRKVWQLQQIATATLATQIAFELDLQAYVIDPDGAYAIMLSPAGIPQAALPKADLVPRMRDRLMHHIQAQGGQPRTGEATPRWIGPIEDPIVHAPAVVAVLEAKGNGTDKPAALVAVSNPATSFLAHLNRPAEPATLWLVNRDKATIDVSPAVSPAISDRVLALARSTPPDTPRLTRDGLLLVQPLNPAFGALVYFLSYGTLASSIATELAIIVGAMLLLIVGSILTARYWDIHLLRRSHAEAARSLENETISHVLVSATPVGLCIVRQEDESILTSNAVADSLLGRGQGARMPAHIMDALRRHGTMTDRSPMASIAQITVAADIAPPSAGAESTQAAARQFLQITCAPATYRDEAVLFCAVQDITAQHQLETQLRTARETAEAMMRARSNFFASMSHEIRTPLSALLGNLELLARTEGLEAHAARLRALQVASEGLQRIVNDILDFSKIDAGEMKLVNEPFRPLGDLESLAMSYSPMVKDKPVRFYVHLSPTLDAMLVGDRTRIAQIINNLLSNAFKFTLCGKITLSAEITTDTQERSVLVCRVRDSGIGMPPTLVARIFHPFVQGEASTSARYGGTGLGLSICARLTELMNGHITVESVEGVGTAFTVAVPLAPAVADVPPPEPVARGTRAMILCQETESGDMLRAWLERSGWRADVFHNVQAAQAWLRANRPHIFVVTGEYGRDTVVALQRLHPANVVWVTRDGPEHPAQLGQGIFEVSTYSHAAILLGTLAALNADPDADVLNMAASDELDNRTIANTPNTAPAATPTRAATSSSARRTILVAEDNVLNQTLVGEQLDTLGWEPVIVGDGRQALSALEHGRFDAVLTDIHMPVMDGYALLSAIRASHPDLPVLAFSAVTTSEQGSDWTARGFTGYVAKPASLKTLEKALMAIPDAASSDSAPANETLIPTADLARYRAILREHLQVDEPELAAILLRHDHVGLRHWAHRSAGAFLIVCEHDTVDLCLQVESLCEQASGWTQEIASAGDALRAAVLAFGEEPASSNR